MSPHKALISVEGSGIEKDRDLITIAPIDLKMSDVNDIVAFVHSLTPLDLGKPIQLTLAIKVIISGSDTWTVRAPERCIFVMILRVDDSHHFYESRVVRVGIHPVLTFQLLDDSLNR